MAARLRRRYNAPGALHMAEYRSTSDPPVRYHPPHDYQFVMRCTFSARVGYLPAALS